LISEVGFECIVCHYVAAMQKRLGMTETSARRVFVHVSKLACTPLEHRSKMYAFNLIREYGRKWSDLKTIISEIQRKTKYKESTIMSMMSFLQHHEGYRIMKSYEGDRFVRHKYVDVDTFVPVSKIVSVLDVMSFYFSASVLGEYSLGSGKSNIYIGAEYVPNMDVIVPYNMEPEIMKNYEKTHDYHESTVRFFTVKGMKKEVVSLKTFLKESVKEVRTIEVREKAIKVDSILLDDKHDVDPVLVGRYGGDFLRGILAWYKKAKKIRQVKECPAFTYAYDPLPFDKDIKRMK